MAEKTKKPSATVILIPKQLRAEWMDVMSLDLLLSNFAFRLACVVGTYLNNYSGSTFISQETIASVMDVSERTVWGGFRELEKAGYLIVKRGAETLSADRKRRSGGQGVANVYLPAFNKSQISAGYRSDKFAKYCDSIWEKHLVNPQKSGVKPAKNCGPTLSLPSEENSTRVRASANEALGAPGVLLLQQLGEDTYRTWFGGLRIEAETADTVTLSAPTKHNETYVRQNYETKMLAAWQSVTPTIMRIVVRFRKEIAA